MENKRYYWLKLNENFFEDDTISWLEEQENGKDYVIFYLKLVLKSLKSEGSLIRYVGETLMPYDIKALSKLTGTPVDTVAIAMKTFEGIGLISILEGGEIYLTQINEMIGSETDVAKRVRKHRIRKSHKEEGETPMLQCNIDETKSNTEIEIEIEIDKDIDDLDYEHILSLFKEYCKDLPQPRKLTGSRKKTLRSWGDVEEMEEVFKLAGESDYLNGRVNGWIASFDWLLKPANRQKVLEGNYINKKNRGVKSETVTGYDFTDEII